MEERRCGRRAIFVKQLEISPTTKPPKRLAIITVTSDIGNGKLLVKIADLAPKIEPKTYAASRLRSDTLIREIEKYAPITSGRYNKHCSKIILNEIIFSYMQKLLRISNMTFLPNSRSKIGTHSLFP